MVGLFRTIKNDMFGIARRLKNIDSGYFVVFSYRDKRYEIHNKFNHGNTFCFAAPALDERVIIKARQTRAERIKRLVAEIEESNRKLQKEEFERVVKKAEHTTESLLKGGQYDA